MIRAIETDYMKRIYLVIAIAAVVVYGLACNKSADGHDNNSTCTDTRAVTDSTVLLAYAKANGITPTADTSWLYYQIITPGTGASPVFNSKVYVRYAAKLMDGTYFDSSGVTLRFALDSLIKGWQYGLPKIKAGGRIKLLVPSALGYGCNGAGFAIPPNSPLYFDVYLDSLK